MTHDRSSIYRALFLVLGCICYRLLSGAFPDLVPNVSPLIAVALVGAIYLPRTGGWLVGPAAFLVTDLAFLTTNYRAGGAMLSWDTAFLLGFYALAGGLGLLLTDRKSLLKILAGSVLCSITFYVLGNTLAWWTNSLTTITPSYAPNLAGWWQANTVGLPGWQPTWTFLRNGALGDLVFSIVLLLAFDPALILHPFRSQARANAARTAI